MKRIDDETLRDFRAVRKAFTSNTEMARALDISDVMVGKILRGKISHFSDATWAKIAPKMKPVFCVHGFDKCPLNGNCELKELIKTITAFDDPAVYKKMNDVLQTLFTPPIHKK